MKALLHTVSGASLPVTFTPLRKLPKFQLANSIKKSMNKAGMADKVIWAEIID